MHALRTIARLSLALSLAACGGGNGGSTDPVPPPAVPPLIQFEAVYDLAGPPPTNRSISLRPVQGSTGFGAHAIARVELAIRDDPPSVLTAPNSLDTAGRPQFVFAIPQYPFEVVFRSCVTVVPLRITVTDVTGFSFVKHDTFCPGQAFATGGFSDYGDRRARYTGSAGRPASVYLTRMGQANYNDRFADAGVTAFDQSFQAKDGDFLTTSLGFDAPSSEVPAGTLVRARIDADGGAFAESTIATNPLDWTHASAWLVCCRPAAGPGMTSAKRKVELVVYGARYNVPNPAPVPFEYRVSVVSPTTGAVVADHAGRVSDSMTWTYDLTVGDQISLQASPTEANTAVVLTVLNVTESPTSGQVLGEARSNLPGTQGRLNLFCCGR